jgi:hypothetical protein
MDNVSKTSTRQVKAAFAEAIRSEALESIVSVLIGVNVQDFQVSRYLKEF